MAAEDGKYPGFIERTKAKYLKGDVRLPNHTGVRDKRLGKGSKVDEMRRGWDVLKGLAAADKKK